MTTKTKPCTIEGCSRPKKPGHPTSCYWHWLAKQPPDTQTREAARRLREVERATGYAYRARVPEREWPAGERWCSGCQTFVPLFYVRGSRCIGCESRAAHGSHVKRTYDLDPAEYERLLEWQGGRCYICRNRPVSRRLAVDHDHLTGRVRGLLCADNERGCNNVVIGALEGRSGDILDIARRIVAYFEEYPIDRMRAGAPPVEGPKRAPGVLEHTRRQAIVIPRSGTSTATEISSEGIQEIDWPPGFEPRVG